MHLPEPLYRAMPYIYVITGMLIILFTQYPIAIVGAALLIMKGLHVFHARLTKRIRRAQLGHHRRCEMAHTCTEKVG